jgi:hypothetical protein
VIEPKLNPVSTPFPAAKPPTTLFAPAVTAPVENDFAIVPALRPTNPPAELFAPARTSPVE